MDKLFTPPIDQFICMPSWDKKFILFAYFFRKIDVSLCFSGSSENNRLRKIIRRRYNKLAMGFVNKHITIKFVYNIFTSELGL
jgi:hypothetical protein